MTRKAKIRFAAGAIAFVAASIAFLCIWTQGEVRVILADSGTNTLGFASFNVTNSFRKEMVYTIETQSRSYAIPGDAWLTEQRPTPSFTNYTGRVPGRSTETVDAKSFTNYHWRIRIKYGEPGA